MLIDPFITILVQSNILINMQKDLEMVAVTANKIALDLVKMEYEENVRSIEEEGRLTYWNHDGLERKHSQMSPVELALSMVDLAMSISEEFYIRGKLAPRDQRGLVKREFQAVREGEEDGFPWGTVMSIPMKNIQKRRELRKILLKYHRSQPRNVRYVRDYFEIREPEWQGWLKNDEKATKQAFLKQAVLLKSSEQPLTLTEFKRLSRKYYRSKLFRPTDTWSLNFITRHNLVSNIDCSHLYQTL